MIQLKDFKWKVLIKTGFLFLMIYFCIGIFIFFIFSNKLSAEELRAVSDVYNEMRLVNNNIKNEFYVNNVLKLLDRRYIMEELRKDSLFYSMYISEKAFNMYQDSLDGSSCTSYLNRCKINYEDFTGLEVANKVYNVSYEFFITDSKDASDLDTYVSLMSETLEPENEYLSKIQLNRSIIGILVAISYCILVGFATYKEIGEKE